MLKAQILDTGYFSALSSRPKGSILDTRKNQSVDNTFNLSTAIAKTLAYSAVFNFPLKRSEISRYLIYNLTLNHSNTTADGSGQKFAIGKGEVDKALKVLVRSGIIAKQGEYYYLYGFKSSVKQRQERERIAQKKLAIGKKFCGLAKHIPTVRLIGVSGALAMDNAHAEDDIDLFIVAAAGTVWITRFLTVMLAEIMGVRRRPDSTPGDLLRKTPGVVVRDKICLNMFVDEEHMSVPPNERDLFSAHEVVQMRPIYNKGNTYYLFIKENEWVRSFLPHAVENVQRSTFNVQRRDSEKEKVLQKNYQRSRVVFLHSVVEVIEHVARKFQLKYMERQRTNEVIADGYLRFHPVDARRIIFGRYEQIIGRVDWLRRIEHS